MKNDENLKKMKNANLFDIAVYDFSLGKGGQSIRKGEITSITLRGVNITTGYGDKFVKWCHVKEIIKK